MDRLMGDQDWSLVSKLNMKDSLKPYCLSAENNIYYYNHQHLIVKDNITARSYLANDALHFGDSYHGGPGTGVPDVYAKSDYSDWLDNIYSDFKKDLADNFEEGWKKLMKYDRYSTRSYLLTKFPIPVIHWLETMDSASGLYDLAFSESIMDSLDFDYPAKEVKWWRFDQGTEQLVKKMLENIKTPEYYTTVTKIRPIKKDNQIEKVKLFFNKNQSRDYHHVISTLPLSIFRSLDTEECNITYKKKLAFRTLHYDHSVKIAIKFKTRWWEIINKIYGGKSSTDLPIRTIVYPSYGYDAEGGGVLIVSYTWAQDAARMGVLEKDTQKLKDLCLSNLAVVHKIPLETLEDDFQDIYIHDWYNDKYSQGAFALYGPGQFSTLFESIIKPELENRLHFAGEATSVHHAWIVGSLNSAYRAVWEMLDDGKRKLLTQQWGTIEEVEKPPSHSDANDTPSGLSRSSSFP
jgi:monoamine oxidase